MNFYKKIIQEEVSLYETNECDIGIPDIHTFSWVDGLSTGPPGLGRHNIYITKTKSKTYIRKTHNVVLALVNG